MSEILHILRYKFLSFIKANIDWHLESVIKNIGSFLVYSGFTVGAFFFTRGAISFLLEQVHIGLFLLHRFLSMLLYVFFLSINAGNIIVSYSTLYKSSEVLYLLTKPVSYTNLFVIKFLDNFFYSSTTLFVVGLSVLAGYGSYFHLPWSFYLWAIGFLFIPFMFLAAIIGVMMLMGVMKLAHVVGARIVIVALGGLYVSSIYAFFKFTNPMKLVNEVMKFYPNINQYFGFLDPPFSKFLPNHWVAESLYWMVVGNFSRTVPYFCILLATCCLVGLAAIRIAHRWYYQSWLVFLGLRKNRTDANQSARMFDLAKRSPLEPQTEVLLKKEFWQFFREPSQWIHLSAIVLLIAIFVGSIMRIDIVQSLTFLQTVSYLVVFLFNAFLISSIALRFVYPMISVEGEAFWKIRSAPVSLHKVAVLKFSAALSLTLIIGQILNGFSRPLTSSSILSASSAANVAFIAVAMVALSFGMGSLFATYKEKNPIRVASSQGASLTFLLSLLYLVFLVAVLFFPINRYFESIALGKPLITSEIFTTNVVIAIVSIVIATISWIISLRALKRDF